MRARSLQGRADKFNSDLSEYIDYRSASAGKTIRVQDVNFEEFLGFLDVQHLLGLRGKETWSADGNEGTVVAKTLIGSVLAEHMIGLKSVPDLYLNFARRLRPGDIVLTFNYDTLLERALDEVGSPYRLFLTHYSKVEHGVFGTTRKETEVTILKVHGSIDWFDLATLTDWGVNTDALQLQPIVHGPSFDEELKGLYRAGNLREAYHESRMFKATPRLLAPSPVKFAYAPQLTKFFHGLDTAGILNFGMAIVGYSLPTHDQYAHQVVYQLVRNYQTNYWEKPAFDRPKTPLVVVDRFSSPRHAAAFKRRYRFVDWGRAELCSQGLNDEAINSIFADPKT